MATRPERDEEPGVRRTEDERGESRERNCERPDKDPDHRYGYGGFREDLLYKEEREDSGGNDREAEGRSGQDG